MIDDQDLINILVKSGANVNDVDNFKQTPLHLSCWYQHKKTVKLMLKFGIEINNQDGHGQTALHLGNQ
jgi:ankyrin repeat protein